ncbi:MAG: efflux RND transporter periplasmic adaptor subunit [Gammaproteobacteria bacterium]|nr:efflux RND transporter periplasmic adaptor subunit [Gammaproteobacteria bacterium]
MKVNFRTVFWIGAAVVVAVLLAFAFRPQPIPVDVARIERGPMRVTVSDEGRTRVRNEYVVSAPVAGRLLRVDYKPGDYAHEGDTVARILPAPPPFLDERAQEEARAAAESAEAAVSAARAEAERAEAQLGFARADLERVRELRSRDLISAEALDRAELELSVAESAAAAARDSVRIREAELAAARARIEQPAPKAGGASATVEVLAPVSGRVLRVAQESENVISAGAEIMTLGDPSNLEVVVELLSTDAVQVSPGADVLIENWGRAAEPLLGRVRLVEPYGFMKVSALGVEEQRVNVIVDFTGPPEEWSALGHGYRVEAAIVTWQRDDVIRAPVAALFRSGSSWAVFRVVDDRAVLTPVEVGRDNGNSAEVLAGLAAGDEVVLYPGERLEDGVRVRRRGDAET